MKNVYFPNFKWIVLLAAFCLYFAAAFASTPFSFPKTAVREAFLAAPTGVQARASLVGAITVEWNAVAGATRYIIAASLNGDGNFEPLTTVSVTAANVNTERFGYRVTDLGYNETYYYRVMAVTGAGDTDYSAAVKATTHPESQVFKIMPLGDSNTHGKKSDDARPEAQRIAYRKQLSDLLTNLKAKFDYVGSEESGSAFLADDEHAGFSGARTRDILGLLKTSSYQNQANETVSTGISGSYLDAFNPDIILLHIGTNGGQYGVSDDPETIAEVGAMLDEVDKYEARAKKEVTVIFATIINRVPLDASDQAPAYTSRFNTKIAALAKQRLQEQSDRLVIVDMEKDAGILYRWTEDGGDMADYLHLAPSGYQKMANTWFGALRPLLQPTTADRMAPETTILAKPAAIGKSNSASFEFGSNETKVYFQVSLNGAAFASTTTPLTLTNLAEGTHTLAVRAVDAAGNVDATPATYSWVVDTNPPAPPVLASVTEDRGPDLNDRITSDNTLRINGKAEANAVVNITENGRGLLGTATANSSGDWSFSYEATTLPQGIYSFTATATDAAGNISAASSSLAVTIDMTAPTVAISSDVSGPVNKAFSVSVKFSEAVYGLAASDFSITNGVLSNLVATDRSTYTATVTPTAGEQGTVAVTLPAGTVTDLAGNSNTLSNKLEATYDFKKPRLTISTVAPALVNLPFTVTFTFDEPVTGFQAEDISLVNGAISNLRGVSAAVYTALVTPVADGEVSVQVAADKAFDAATNGNMASVALTRLYDVQKPTVMLGTAAAEVTNKPFTVNITFSEPVTGLTAGDITVNNGTASQLQGVSGSVYSVLITPGADGEVTVVVAADAAQDAATNGNTGSAVLNRLYDGTRPTVAVTTTASALINVPFTATFDFSEDVEGYALADIILSNAVANNFNRLSNRSYNALITPAADGEVSVRVAANSAQDAATNGNTASNVLKLQYDATAPAGYAVQFEAERIDVNNQEQVALRVAGAEAGAVYFYTITSSNGGDAIAGTASATAAGFSILALDLSSLPDGTLTVTFYLMDAAGNRGADVKAEILKVTKNVTAVTNLSLIRVPFKTAYEKVPLPERLEVTYSSGEKEGLQVNWQRGDFIPEVPGRYTLTGDLVLASGTTNIDGLKASVVVEVEPNKAPTDIHFSATSLKPDTKAHEVIGAFTTADPDDTEHVYELIGSGNDNALFELTGNQLYLKSNRGLSGLTSFTIMVRSTDPYQNKIEKTFTLKKSAYEPETKIKLVNAFSPDNDGYNDTWTVPELRYYNEIDIQVFDRAGVLLFHTVNPEEGWDGRGRNGKVQPGSYFYVIQVKDINLVQKGVLTVLK